MNEIALAYGEWYIETIQSPHISRDFSSLRSQARKYRRRPRAAGYMSTAERDKPEHQEIAEVQAVLTADSRLEMNSERLEIIKTHVAKRV